MHFEDEIIWSDVTPGWHGRRGPQHLHFDPHPSDYELEDFDWSEMVDFMNCRYAELTEVLTRMGNGDSWSGCVYREDPYGSCAQATIAARMVDLGVAAVATLDTTISGEGITEIIIGIPEGRIERFAPMRIIPSLAGLTEKDRKTVMVKIMNVVQAHKGGSLGFLIRTAADPEDRVEAIHDFKLTVVRAILQWTMWRDGVLKPALKTDPASPAA